MIEAAEASGELEPGRELLEPTSGNTGISLALVAKLKGYPLTCVLPENATEERRAPAAALRRGDRRSPGRGGLERRRAASRSSSPSATPRFFMPFQYANEANPRAHYEGTGAEIAEALERVDVLVAGLGTGGTLMGTGERLRESFPDVVVAAAEPLPGDPVMGLRSLDDGYVPPILDVVEARPEAARLERGVGRRRCARCSTRRASSPASPPARSSTSRAGWRPSSTRASSSACSPTAAGSTSPPTSGTRTTSSARWSAPSGGDPGRRSARALVEHARAEAPNEACGLRRPPRRRRRALRRAAGTRAASPYRFELEVDPEMWFLEDEGYELAVFHSHLSSPPRPSRTDVENIGLWQGRPYLILSLATGSSPPGGSRTAASSRSRTRRRCREPPR